MTLYDECKIALGNNFQELNKEESQYAVFLFNNFPIAGTGVLWEEIQFFEYNDANDLWQAVKTKKQSIA